MVISLVLVAITASYCGSGTGNNSGNSSPKTSSTGTSEIVFREYQHEFGKVAEGEKLSYIFTFDNKGTTDLIIYSSGGQWES